MRLNKYLAENTALSRRSADTAIEQGKVTINGQKALVGAQIGPTDHVQLAGQLVIAKNNQKLVILLHKPVGYVCSKDGQGSPTIYDLLPNKYHNLNIAGRLDKDSSGLVVFTNDGDLLNKLTHPKYNKNKVYEIELNKPLKVADRKAIEHGIHLEDGISKLNLKSLDNSQRKWQVTMHEGRNRQIRRTFSHLKYSVAELHRISIGDYKINALQSGKYITID